MQKGFCGYGGFEKLGIPGSAGNNGNPIFLQLELSAEIQEEKRMTMESLNAARDIVVKINSLDEHIEILEELALKDTTKWIMEIRPNMSAPLMSIKHDGLLPEILNVILAKLTEERTLLTRDLDNL